MDDNTDTGSGASLVGTVLLGKLRVDSVLGRGGMGTVYRVTHLGTRHARALKVMNASIRLHEEALARFLREATVSATLNSPYVVETIDQGRLDDGSFYVLMELLDGESLADILDRGRIALPRIAKLLRQACGALALAHDKGIVHRDIKPDNLFVTKNADGEEMVKILDFGIARFRDHEDLMSGLTAENAILGTPLYMAPEQIGTASQADGRADVYALGVVLYEALAGRKPYAASSFAELVTHIFDGNATPLSRTAPGLSPRAYEIVAEAMARKPADRFQTVTALGEALRELESAPVHRSDALAATMPSLLPPPAALPREIAPTRASMLAPSRAGSIVPWVVGAVAIVAVVAFATQPPRTGTSTSTSTGTSTSTSPDAGPDAASPVAPPMPSLAPPPSTTTTTTTTTTRARRDAGTRHTDGLAGPDEVYGEER